ncbi:carotenoid 1,2-hydratase [Vibrio europaeus]|uniref:Carotenoid 1,2-hydratase n=1 Tax=Vibrio europaeus TaxID=300876 RepID=A0AAE7E0M9_9VIBR|nr:lipocalin-like domain-containing protein [Vibrio europaeus]MDC5805477.1 carotenoid 1,2-hydratase [Vibrio europaeus]MDC5811217.1 carotenoid 1,2-hydratase [Vibrio europaeus]MDC5826448.1 carotenoid 1,2-hydratase [Vibrio europaeus]MDC5831814.1 carotenoid 1,2-hydratase [Vibrio europaeus]MDC5834769.1 carotenoid 1,2-hydratase [Vibrio europaeus]
MNRLARNLTWLLGSLLLLGCEKPQQQNMAMLLGSGEAQSESNPFTPVVKGIELTFPADHQAHPSFRHEWWYFTANLIDENGNPLGVQWTQFRFAAAPEDGENKANKTVWRSQQIYMAHSAVTTPDKHYADEKWSRDQASLAGVDASPFRVYLDDWQWHSSTDDLFPATLNASSEQFGYSLTLTSSAPYQKQGEQGYSTKSADGQVASYYYSQPFIDVSGQVIIDGNTHQVTGKGWIDREWSSQFLLDSQQGWDWFALRLSDETSLVVFQLRDSKTGKASYSSARLMRQDGSGIAISPNEIQLNATKQTEIQGRNYPTEWQVAIPSQQIELVVSALNPNAKMPLSVPYWEGPVRIDGTHSGSGYMELTGY